MTQSRSISGARTKNSPKQANRAALSAFLGGALEYYDFILFASAAAIIFPRVFFPDAESSNLLSFATFGVAYLARPIGAIVIGHLGDKFGRKNALLLTLLLMGLATFIIGCLPSYEQIGGLASLLLVAMRLLQGFSAGGEIAGASSLSIEHAPAGRRAFYGSWTIQGVGAGTLLASIVMLPVMKLPDELLFSWGWRIPFLASLVVLLLTYFVRRTVDEPEIFTEAKETGKTAKLPLLEAFKTSWANIIRVVLMTLHFIPDSVIAVFGAAYAISMGMDRTTVVVSTIVTNLVALAIRPIAGTLADRIGRKPVFFVGAIGSGASIFAYFAAIDSGSTLLFFLAQAMTVGLFVACCGAIYPAFYAEMFNARTRYSGMAISLQFGSVIAGFAPTLGTILAPGSPDGWMPIAALTAIALLIAALATLSARETFKTPLHALGYSQKELAVNHGRQPAGSTTTIADSENVQP